MELPKIWLSPPHMGGAEQGYINKAFNDNWIAPLGPNLNAFEESLEAYLDGESFVGAVNSGTAAIHLGLLLLGVQQDDEVLCQSFTFVATANPILYLGATPVFIDSEPDSWNLCPNALEDAIIARRAIGKNPKAIIAVHLYGMPYKVDEINRISEKYGIPVLEDSAEALGSTYNNKKCGTFGTVSALSFNGNKIITTSGGGAIITKSDALKQRALYLATQARADKPYYHHTEIGYNYRMSNISAGIGLGQMEVLDNHVALRREMHLFYEELFKNIIGITLFNEYDSAVFCNYWLTAIVIDADKTNGITNEIMLQAFRDDNIESRLLWKPMHLQPVFKDYPYYGGTVCAEFFKKGLCLPSGSNLKEEEKDRIKTVLLNLFNQTG